MLLKQSDTIYEVETKYMPDQLISQINERSVLHDAKKINDNLYSVILEGKNLLCHFYNDNTNAWVNIDGITYHFEKIDETELIFDDSVQNSSNIQIVKAPMPGSVVKVLVHPGQEVDEGDALIAVEAMKMETTIYSNISGIVSELSAVAGEQVSSDKILMRIEKINESN